MLLRARFGTALASAFAAALLVIGASGCASNSAAIRVQKAQIPEDDEEPMGSPLDRPGKFKIVSPAFKYGAAIPAKYTCEGDNVAPPLVFDGIPTDARGLVLIVDDPDTKTELGGFVHWVLYSMPQNALGIPGDSELPGGTREGKNSWQRRGYGGPCPPRGRHRYVFKLYALDISLPDMHGPTRKELEAVMQGHIMAQTKLIGTYQKSKADQVK